jgi:hypothetical protein
LASVVLFWTTTATDVDEELMNRCLVIWVSEDRELTRAIHRLQREQETIEGQLAQEKREAIIKLHQNAQRLLQPVKVHNPYARQLTFIDTQTRTRRDNPKYLALIRTIAFLHQYQRPRKTRMEGGKEVVYIEVTKEDIAIANVLANEVLGRSLDELSSQTQQLLMRIEEMVRAACERLGIEQQDYRFSRRDVREHTGWSNTQVHRHLRKLEDLEYVLAHRGSRGQSMVYELVYEGQGKAGERFMLGLADASKLAEHAYDDEHCGAEAPNCGSIAGQLRAISRGMRVEPIGPAPSNGKGFDGSAHPNAENTDQEEGEKPPLSYVVAGRNGEPLETTEQS